MNLQLHREKHHQNTEPHGFERVLQTLVYSFAKITEMKCTMKCQEIPSVQPSTKIRPLHYEIHKIYTFSHPCNKGIELNHFIKNRISYIKLGPNF